MNSASHLVTSLEQAQNIWQRFYQENNFFVPEQKQKTSFVLDDEIKKRYETKYSNPDNLKKIITIQKHFRNLRSKDTLVDVLPKNHSFQNLFGREAVKESWNAEKIKRMEEAIHLGNWDDPIFNDKGYHIVLWHKGMPNYKDILPYRLYLFCKNGNVLKCSVKDKDDIIDINLNKKLTEYPTEIIKILTTNPKIHALQKEQEDIIWKVMSDFDKKYYSETVPQIALSLLTSKKISQIQLYTILERHQMFKDYNFKKNYKILDEHGRFTDDAMKTLIPAISKRKRLKNLMIEDLESFRLLVSCLPVSEQIFYTTELSDLRIPNTFGYNLADDYDVIYIYNDEVVELSNGGKHALGLTRFGIENYVVPTPGFGIKTPSDIEIGVRKFKRHQAMHFTGTRPYILIHTNHGVTFYVAAKHDESHALQMSLMPKCFSSLFAYMVDVLRDAYQITNSRETWVWTDQDYDYFVKLKSYDPDNIAEMTSHWCNMLKDGDNDDNYGKYGYLYDGISHATSSGIIIYLNQIKKIEEWISRRVSPGHLVAEFQIEYYNIRNIYDFIKNDRPMMQVFKCLLYFNLVDKNDFVKLNELINTYSDQVYDLLGLKKHDFEDRAVGRAHNSVYLTFNNVPVKYMQGDLGDLVKQGLRQSDFQSAKVFKLIDPKFLLTMLSNPSVFRSQFLSSLDYLSGYTVMQYHIDYLIQHCQLTSDDIQNAKHLINLKMLLEFTYYYKIDISYLKQFVDKQMASMKDILILSANDLRLLATYHQYISDSLSANKMTLLGFFSQPQEVKDQSFKMWFQKQVELSQSTTMQPKNS